MMNSFLISPEALHACLNDVDIALLDASFSMPGAELSADVVFQNIRLPGAQRFDIDDIADPDNDLPHMLPPPALFAEKVGALGISNKTRVIIYGQQNIAMGPARAWWMFRTFGHDNVQVLNASLQAWQAQGLPVESGPPATPEAAHFNCTFRPAFVVSKTDIQNLEDAAAEIIDARPPARFNASAPEPREGLRSGHIPGSRNIPAADMINMHTGGLVSEADLEKIFSAHPELAHKNIISSCGSGVTACVLALALAETRQKNVAVYDGSWTEWGDVKSGTLVEK